MESTLRKRVKTVHPTQHTTSNSNGNASVELRKDEKAEGALGVRDLAPSLGDLSWALGLVYGGCCSNVIAYEQLLLYDPRIGSALTFCQMAFVTLQTISSFLTWPKGSPLPTLKKRQVPLTKWIVHVAVLTAGSLLNNWAYAYKVPLPVLIVFRSAGLPVSLIFGYLFLQKRYSFLQILSVALVSVGAVLSALSGSSSTSSLSLNPDDAKLYLTGIGMLLGSLICTATLGLLQEKTYKIHGPAWKEGLFYTHFLALPIFLPLITDIRQGLNSLHRVASFQSGPNAALVPYIVLLANLVTQFVCVTGVNQLSSRVSSVSTNIALTVRKALSLCLSVWWFGNPWNNQLGVGAGMVFLGSLLYTTCA